MKVAIVQFSKIWRLDQRETPLKILSVASYIEKYGHEPIIFDIPVTQPHLDFFSITSENLLSKNPAAICFYVLPRSLPSSIILSKHCKKINPNLHLIFFCSDVFFNESELLKIFNEAAVIIHGETEISLAETLDTLEKHKSLNNINGISYMDHSHFFQRNPDRQSLNQLDRLPFLNYNLLDNSDQYRATQVEAGRENILKKPQRLVDEIRHAFLRFHSRVYITNNDFLRDRVWLDRFLNNVCKYNLFWYCNSKLRILDSNLIRKLKSSGCVSVNFTAFSSCPNIADILKNNIKDILGMFNSFFHFKLPFNLSITFSFSKKEKAISDCLFFLALKSKLYSPILFQFVPFIPAAHRNRNSSLSKISKWAPFLTRLPEEVALVKKHPQLFPYCFSEKSNSFNPELLQKISALFTFLCNFFPLTTLLLLDFFSCSPFKLCKLMIFFFDKKNIEWKPILIRKDFFFFYLPLLKEYLASLPHSIPGPLMDIYVYEKILQQNSFSINVPSTNSISPFNPTSRPKLSKDVTLITFNYNPFEIKEALKNNYYHFTKKCSFVAYVPGEITRAVSLNQFSYSLLAFCNGNNSVKDILDIIYRKNPSLNKSSRQTILKTFTFLQEQGVI